MANPQPDNGHIDIANSIADKFRSYRISGQEWQIIWVILRKTWGWLINPKEKKGPKKKIDRIALSQFEKETKIDRRKCHAILKKLIQKRVIIKTITQKGDRRMINYGFQKNYDLWRMSPKKAHTKDTITKDTITKDTIPPCPQKEIIALYHEILPSLPMIEIWPKSSEKQLKMRWREDPKRQYIENWREFFKYVKKSEFLMGDNDRGWTADLFWIVGPKNFAKILSGKYHKNQKNKLSPYEEFINERIKE